MVLIDLVIKGRLESRNGYTHYMTNDQLEVESWQQSGHVDARMQQIGYGNSATTWFLRAGKFNMTRPYVRPPFKER